LFIRATWPEIKDAKTALDESGENIGESAIFLLAALLPVHWQRAANQLATCCQRTCNGLPIKLLSTASNKIRREKQRLQNDLDCKG